MARQPLLLTKVECPVVCQCLSGCMAGAFFVLMTSKELMQLLRESDRQVKAAKTVIGDSAKTGMHFVNLELDLSLTFAERALASFSTGDLDDAMRTARDARHGHRTAWKFLPTLKVTAEQRELIEEKLAELEVMMTKLSVLK